MNIKAEITDRMGSHPLKPPFIYFILMHMFLNDYNYMYYEKKYQARAIGQIGCCCIANQRCMRTNNYDFLFSVYL